MWLSVHGNTQRARSAFWIITWCLNILQMLVHGIIHQCMICMLQVRVHCAGIICTIACYEIGTIFLIVNMEYYIIVFNVQDSLLQICIVSAEFISSHFCWFNFSLRFIAWVVRGEFDWRICSSLTCLQFLYGSSTWIQDLKLALGTLILNWAPTYLLIWSKQVLL